MHFGLHLDNSITLMRPAASSEWAPARKNCAAGLCQVTAEFRAVAWMRRRHGANQRVSLARFLMKIRASMSYLPQPRHMPVKAAEIRSKNSPHDDSYG